jgi:subtilase family serine protease
MFVFYLKYTNNKNYKFKTNITDSSPNFYVKGYTPNQIKHAYGIDKINLKGTNQKIAIIVPYGSPSITKDLDIFNKQFKLESCDLKIYYPQEKVNTINFNWAQETSLDVEWVHALAPKAYISLIVSKSDSKDDLINAVDYAVNNGFSIISMSWGFNEFKDELEYESHFSNKNIIFIASAGDRGAQVNWPAVSPNVLSIGGTTLSLDNKGNLEKNESAWNFSGGGNSIYINQPDYQKKYGIKFNKNTRVVPDVSFYGDFSHGVDVYCSTKYNPSASGWITLAGTSLGPPAWSAFIALVNEKNRYPINNIHDKLYNIAKDEKKYKQTFRDITYGNNITNNTNDDNKNYATIEYDSITGLGSPIENILLNKLVKK